ncbi:MAG: ABC transporter permease [Acidimicrobiia bacterium]
MTPGLAVLRNEARLAVRDPLPVVVLLAMPAVLMALLAPALALALASEGYVGAPGSSQAVPGMVTVFSFFVVAFVGFALFREHGWRTWPRLRAAGLGGAGTMVGKLALPAAMLAVQHLVLFVVGSAFLDLEVAGPAVAVVAVSAAYGAVVLAAGLAAAAVLSTIQQVNAVTNLGAMVLGGLGGGFVPVSTLPGWVRPVAPVSPAYWAMEGYRAVVLDGEGLAGVARPVGVLAAFAMALGWLAVRRLRLDDPKRTWG